MPILALLLTVVTGLVVGVIINRAADNLPPPDSRPLFLNPRCPHCGRDRTLAEQSGLLSFVIWRGGCRHCSAPRALRAPLVELACAALFPFLYGRLGPGLPFLVLTLFSSFLLLITVIDLEHRLILNVVVLPATILALVLRPLLFMADLQSSADPLWRILISTFAGAAVGYVVVFGIYLLGALFARVMSRRRGRSIDEVAFGMGDVKLAGLVGALVGLTWIFQALLYAILLGGLVSAAVLIFQLVVRHRYSAYMAIPYGPFFAVAGWLVLMGAAGPVLV